MFTDIKTELATIRQQELLDDAAASRIARPDRMIAPDRRTNPIRIGWLFRRLAGPTPI